MTPSDPPESRSSPAARRVPGARSFALAFAVAQFAAIAWFGVLEVQNADLTWDFGIFYRAYTAIAGGDFNPFVSFTNVTYLRDHAAFLSWPISLLSYVSQSQVVLKFVQACGVAVAGYVAALWCVEIVEERTFDPRTAATAAYCSIVAIFIMPWPYWGAAFDFHFLALVGAFVTIATRELYHGRYRNAWFAAAAMVLGTEVAAPLVAGLGVTLVVARPKAWPQAVGFVVAAVVYLFVVDAVVRPVGSQIPGFYGWIVAPDDASHLTALGVPVAIAAHPLAVARELIAVRWEGYASLAPSGMLGILSPWTAGTVPLTLLENLLTRGKATTTSAPGFQYASIYALLVPGFVSIVASRRLRLPAWSFRVAFALLACNAAGWAVVWLPLLPHAWLRTSPLAAATLHELRARIATSAEIIASHGSMGLFGRNASLYTMVRSGDQIPVERDDVHVIFTPFDGIQPAESSETLAMIQAFMRDPRASLETSSGDVWSFTYRPDPGQKNIGFDASDPILHGGLFRTDVGQHDLSAGIERSSVFVDGDNPAPGYLAHSVEWRRPVGDYSIRVRLSCVTTCIVEVSDATQDRTLVTRAISSPAISDQTFDVSFLDADSDTGPSGWGPFFSPPVDLRPNARMELRIYVPMHATARVYEAQITPR